MRRIDAERNLDYPNSGYMEAQRETIKDEMQVENYDFIRPDWKAWTKCPLFKWLAARKRKQDLALATCQSMEYARKFGLMMIVHEDGFEFCRTAIIRRESHQS